MIKKILGLVVVATIIFSCGNKEQKKEADNNNEVVAVTVDEVLADMQSYVEKEITIIGTVNHVCAHGGKRMFIIGTDPDAAIKITPSDEIGVFETELVGSHILVSGTVKELRIDEAYVANLEKEIAEDSDSEAIHDHSGGEHDETEEVEDEKKAQIDAMKVKIAESGKDYYSQFWIEASKFEVKECDHDHTEGEEHDHIEGKEHDHAEGEDHDHDHEDGEEHTH